MAVTMRAARATDAEAAAAPGREFVEYLRALGAESFTGCEQERFVELHECG